MDSLAHTNLSKLNRLLPFAAVFTEDLRQSFKHWAFIAWAVIGCLTAAVWLIAPTGVEPRATQATQTVASNAVTNPVSAATAADYSARFLRAHLLAWASFAIMLGASSIASESEFAADAVLCRGVSRWQYYLGKCLARITVVLILFTGTTVPAVMLAASRLSNDLTVGGTFSAMQSVGIALVAVTAIGVAGSIWFRNGLIACAVVWLCLYGFGIVASILDIRPISPVVLADRLVFMLRSAEGLGPHYLLTLVVLGALAATLGSLGAYCVKDV